MGIALWTAAVILVIAGGAATMLMESPILGIVLIVAGFGAGLWAGGSYLR